MIDLALNRRLDNCRQIMKAWHTYHSYLTGCMKGKPFEQKDEGDFLKLKSQIAILHDSFLEAVDTGARETAAISQSVITLVERSILLRQLSHLSAAELKRRANAWKPRKPRYKRGVLAKYERLVSSASEGAVTDLPE